MPSHERTIENRVSPRIGHYTLSELKGYPEKFEALLETYCDVFKGPPWNEEWWTNDLAQNVIEGQLEGKFSGDVFLIEEEDSVIGFYWGCEGDTDEVVRYSVDAFLSRDYPEQTKDYVVQRLTNEIQKDQEERDKSYPEKLYYSCEFGILPERRGVGLGRILRMGCEVQIEKGNADLMYGMTDVESMLYRVISNRGGRTIFPMSEISEGNSWVFMLADVENFVRSR